jgi:hypothetical protein
MQQTTETRQSAADQFRAAFERLKDGSPMRMPPGTAVSQNNVAREAGTDPTALRKSRFPTLVAEIQGYVSEHERQEPVSARQVGETKRKANRSLQERLFEVSRQRDILASKLCEADPTILELRGRFDQLAKNAPESNVVRLAKSDEKVRQS